MEMCSSDEERDPLRHASEKSRVFRRVGVGATVLCLLFVLLLLAGLNVDSRSSPAPLLKRDGLEVRGVEARVHYDPPTGSFSLWSGEDRRLEGWIRARATPTLSPFRQSPHAGCMHLSIPNGTAAHFSISSGGWWYGGPELSTANWPLNPTSVQRQPFSSSDMLAHKGAIGSVLEAMWLTSSGAALRVVQGGRYELSFNVRCEGEVFPATGKLCLWPLNSSGLVVEMCAHAHVRAAQISLLSRLPRPSHAPSVEILRAPIWSTWARYKMAVDQSLVQSFAAEILAHDFPRSHMEIDDRWSVAYGDFVFDESKFPDPAGMVAMLHSQGFSVTLWIIPFAEPSSSAFTEGAALGHWLVEDNGKPALVRWWQGRGAVLNVSDDRALDWFEQRLRRLMNETGVDGFKFDAGEGEFAPLSLVPLPNLYAGRWARFAARFGGGGEVRSAHESQDAATCNLGYFRLLRLQLLLAIVWVREFDKQSRWDTSNGLRSLVSSALQFGVLGYAWVLPDMVGGNAYNDDAPQPAEQAPGAVDEAGQGAGGARNTSGFWYGSLPDEELYTRWCTANALLPALQFSIAPWQYDAKVVSACQHALGEPSIPPPPFKHWSPCAELHVGLSVR
ncbi:MAG: hypothetical protein SGPRY_003561 [Prymnesium sp.]